MVRVVSEQARGKVGHATDPLTNGAHDDGGAANFPCVQRCRTLGSTRTPTFLQW